MKHMPAHAFVDCSISAVKLRCYCHRIAQSSAAPKYWYCGGSTAFSYKCIMLLLRIWHVYEAMPHTRDWLVESLHHVGGHGKLHRCHKRLQPCLR